jgi:SAM-dependent methyltransferase
LGHDCVGIDYSPASIAYAIEQANKGNLRCTYLHQDIRTAEYGKGFGLAMLIYGEFNVFRPADARKILQKAYRALASKGLLLLEPHTFVAIRKIGKQGTSWYSSKNGLFSDSPYLCLEESFWETDSRTATTRYIVIDVSTEDITRYAQSFQAYTNSEYQSILTKCGFGDTEFFPSLVGTEDESQRELIVIVARKEHYFT